MSYKITLNKDGTLVAECNTGEELKEILENIDLDTTTTTTVATKKVAAGSTVTKTNKSLKVGDKVTWTSHGAAHSEYSPSSWMGIDYKSKNYTRTGKVIQIVPPGKRPNARGLKCAYESIAWPYINGRLKESYLVEAQRPSDGKVVVYWPHVSKLQRV